MRATSLIEFLARRTGRPFAEVMLHVRRLREVEKFPTGSGRASAKVDAQSAARTIVSLLAAESARQGPDAVARNERFTLAIEHLMRGESKAGRVEKLIVDRYGLTATIRFDDGREEQFPAGGAAGAPPRLRLEASLDGGVLHELALWLSGPDDVPGGFMSDEEHAAKIAAIQSAAAAAGKPLSDEEPPALDTSVEIDAEVSSVEPDDDQGTE